MSPPSHRDQGGHAVRGEEDDAPTLELGDVDAFMLAHVSHGGLVQREDDMSERESQDAAAPG